MNKSSLITVIIHGWSDSSDSFQDLKSFLVRKGIGTVKTILYADYESREDHLTFDDVIDGLQDEFLKHGIIGTGQRPSLNVICHSTGALVIRHWIWRYYGRDGNIVACPVKRMVMLAPANFGSHLAHRGKSFFGAFLKGRRNLGDFLETGRQILDGLELGSPYQWALAERDLIQEKPYFNASQIQTTILVGIEGFGGFAQFANRPGTDGTVPIAGTSLDSAKLVLDFAKPRQKEVPYAPYEWVIDNPKEDIAFGVLESLNHGSIVQAAGEENHSLSRIVLNALTTKSIADFRKHQEGLEVLTKNTYQKTGESKFQQFIVRTIDDQAMPVPDFTLDFFIWKFKALESGDIIPKKMPPSSKERLYSEKIAAALTENFHTHSKDFSYRCFWVNLTKTNALIQEAKQVLGSEICLSMRIYIPEVDKGIRYDVSRLQNIVLFHTGQKTKGMPSFFYENTTTLLELRVDRFNEYVTISESPRKH